MFSKLVNPFFKILEGGMIANWENNDRTHGITIEGTVQCTESLLAGGIPDLETDFLVS